MESALVRDVIQWDTGNWSTALEFWERKIEWNGRKYRCLELGSGQGGLSTWLALKGHHVICSDLHGISERASPLHRKYNVQGFIDYQDIDAAHIPYENYFDIVIFKSILGGIGRNDNIHNQKLVVNQIHKALKSGGKLLFAENLKGTFIHNLFRLKFVRWGTEWRYVSLREVREFLKAFSSVEIKTTGITGTFGRTENQKILLAKMDKAVLNRFTPEHWKYIAYGVAVK